MMMEIFIKMMVIVFFSYTAWIFVRNEVEQRGYKRGREDALKDLPKWKKARFDSTQKARICLSSEDMNNPHYTNCIKKNEYYIDFEDLKKLPKEE